MVAVVVMVGVVVTVACAVVAVAVWTLVAWADVAQMLVAVPVRCASCSQDLSS